MATCAHRLAAVGVVPVDDDPGALAWPDEPASGAGTDLACGISWWGGARPPGTPGSEALVQAATGLMYLHGRDLGGPRRIGIEIATVAAGVLAAQGLLAAAIGRRRGSAVSHVQTSVVHAGLMQASHQLAAATCPPEEVPPPGPDPGPPFATSDGRWFEIETFDTEPWKAFWLRLGAPADQLGQAWTRFRPRYYRGTTSLPAGFHQATAACSLAELTALARDCGVSLAPVRSYDEVLAPPGPVGSSPIVDSQAAGPATGTGAATAGGPPGHPPAGSLPLAGLEVVEATSRMQGPLAGLLLQMLGARVTRVESPGGDVGRSVPPLAGDTGSFFLCFNRGKDTVELDLATPAGRGELADRVAAADVFVHNWRPGKAAEWGLDADSLHRGNPGLVHAEASGWAPGSAASPLIGTDFLVQAWTGVANSLAPDPEPPRPSRVLLTAFMGALVTCEGVLAGLYRREQQRGLGCRVRTSLEAGGMALQAHVLDGMAGGSEAGRHRGRPRWGPLDGPVPTGDGWLVIHLAGDDDLRQLGQLCGFPASGDRADLEGAVTSRLATGSAAEWVGRLNGAGIGCARVATDLAAVAHDPALAAMFEPLAATCRAPASPWQIG
ncbi:MAG: CoA transferase [Acidimicrobiales bacterium]